MRDKAITMTLFNRPDYTQVCIKALSECVGIEDYLILPTVEPGNQEVIDLLRGIRFAECDVVVNPVKLGCNKNIWKAVDRGFRASDFVIHVEDDVILAPDALKFFEFCKHSYASDKSVHTVGAFNREQCGADKAYSVFQRPCFICWAWGTWRDRWEEPGGLRACWDVDHQHLGWDHHIHRTLRKDRTQVSCVLSRAQNIGAENGVYTPSAAWHRDNVFLECWAGNAEFKDAVAVNSSKWAAHA